MLRATRRPKIRDVVVERLRSYVAENGLAAGDRLPTENELAKRFGVSRLSVREATKSLELFGIVESKPGVGLTVGAVDFHKMAEQLGFHPSLHQASQSQLIDTRVILEVGTLPHVARQIAEKPEIYDRLNAIVEKMRHASEIPQIIELDILFHRELVESSGLTPLVAIGEMLQVFFQKVRNEIQLNEWPDGIASHQRLIEMLRAGEVAAASEELRNHIESHKRRIGGSA